MGSSAGIIFVGGGQAVWCVVWCRSGGVLSIRIPCPWIYMMGSHILLWQHDGVWLLVFEWWDPMGSFVPVKQVPSKLVPDRKDF